MNDLKACSSNQLYRLKPYLDEWVNRIEKPSFIEDDPVRFMHIFNKKQDQAAAGLFAALMAWGRREIVLSKVTDLLGRMDNQPADFIHHFSEQQTECFAGFKHRTFKPADIIGLTKCLQEIFLQYGSLEDFWSHCYQVSQQTRRELIAVFHQEFFEMSDEIPARTRKHIANPEKGSSCKRLYMYLRWVIRNGSSVDPGIMNFMEPSELIIPLDVHCARQARRLGLLTRRYNDWKAAVELTRKMRLLDPGDPAKYDFALFGIGAERAQIPVEFVINPVIK
jgi:uncharacterized protein (TIGR02757 family)